MAGENVAPANNDPRGVTKDVEYISCILECDDKKVETSIIDTPGLGD
jgi:septin family protein